MLGLITWAIPAMHMITRSSNGVRAAVRILGTTIDTMIQSIRPRFIVVLGKEGLIGREETVPSPASIFTLLVGLRVMVLKVCLHHFEPYNR